MSSLCVNRTLFSSEQFISAWVSGKNDGTRALKLDLGTDESGPIMMWGIAHPGSFGYSNAEFGPDGLYACPSSPRIDDPELVSRALARFKGGRLLGVGWSIRFDHSGLAEQLQQTGLPCQMSSTHVLELNRPHHDIFEGYRP